MSVLPDRQICSVSCPETPTFILCIPRDCSMAAPTAASPDAEQLLAQLGGCRPQLSTQAVFLKCLPLSVNTTEGAERARVSIKDSITHWW